MPATENQTSNLIAPHGGSLVDRTVSGDAAQSLAAEAAGLPRVRMTEKQTADLDMIASRAPRFAMRMRYGNVEFVSAIREGREPESSAASCLPTMVLLDAIDKAMNP